MKKQSSSARISMHPLFLEVLKENHNKITRLNFQVSKLRKDLAFTGKDNTLALQQKLNAFEQEMEKSSVVVIVFAAMSVEAYIYDYAARHLGDAYAKDHLDKLDTVSKWVIIPELIGGKELPERQTWYPPLKNLIKTRNAIIHHKSSMPPTPLTPSDINLYVQRLNRSSSLILETAMQSIVLLGTLADKISEIDPEETPWVQSYLV